MNQPEILDSDIRALQQWLHAAWRQLGDPSLTTFSRRELRNQMKQCSADLRARLQMAAEQQSEPLQQPVPPYSRPELRILFISGYADMTTPPEADNPNVSFLSKPFQASVLSERVSQMLARPGRAPASPVNGARLSAVCATTAHRTLPGRSLDETTP